MELKRSKAGYVVAVVGATGAVGREMIKVLEERDFPVAELRAYASSRSAGEQLAWAGGTIEVQVLPDDPPDDIGIALFSAGGAVSRSHAPRFAAKGAVVIDNSSAWRMDGRSPLVVPECNGQWAFAALTDAGNGIIANPNCSTIQLVVALKPLADAFGLKSVVISTYQAVSGAGQAGVDELSEQVVALFNNGQPEPKHLPHAIAFNCIPSIGTFRDDGFTDEEWKLVAETRRILALPDLAVSPTCVRVPTFSCHAESVRVTLGRKASPQQVAAAFHQAEGLVLQDMPAEQLYPMGFPLAGTDDVYVGRIRQDPFDDHAILMWVVADNLRKGAALNAVQIAEVLDEGPEE